MDEEMTNVSVVAVQISRASRMIMAIRVMIAVKLAIKHSC